MAPRLARVLGAIVRGGRVVCGYALLTKVFPGALAADDVYARLREPFGYWNAVGLMAALGRARRAVARRAPRRPRARSTRSPTRSSGCCSSLMLLPTRAARCWRSRSALRVLVRASCRCGCAASAVLLGAAPSARCAVVAWVFAQDALTKDNVSVAARATPGTSSASLLLADGRGAARRSASRSASPPRAARRPSRARRRAGAAILVALALVAGRRSLLALALSTKGLGGTISTAGSR